MNKDYFICAALTIFLVFLMLFMVWDATKSMNPPVPAGYHYERTENVMYNGGESYRIVYYYQKDDTK